jgi:decaprenylphospho-beta-D-ribofuranose 2-oxidase
VVARSGRDLDTLIDAVKDLPDRGGIARGLGRSYGDPAQNGGGVVLRLADRPHDVVIDEGDATVFVPAGVSLDDLLKALVPRGFFVPVSPGTRFVTVGGAIASDIHGKNHHVEGSFGNHVVRLSLLLADGTVVSLGPDERPDLFWATIGGMGLTGVILDANVRVLPIETSRISVDTTRTGDLGALLALMEEGDRYYRYSVAWIDLMAKGAHLGRSVLTRGDHATTDQLEPRDAVEPLAYAPRQVAAVPPRVPP